MADKNTEERKTYTSEFKFKVVKEALCTDQSVSEICKKDGIGTNIFYKWQERFLASAKEGLKSSQVGPTKAELRRIAQLETDNDRMKNVIAEVISENIELKKKFMG